MTIRSMWCRLALLALTCSLLVGDVFAQETSSKKPAAAPPQPQNPSPMVENTRAHTRVAKTELPGRRVELSLGTLFVPAGVRTKSANPLILHFHGAPWLAELSAMRSNPRAIVISVTLGAGSSVYSTAFADPNRFHDLLAEAAKAVAPSEQVRFFPVILSSFSAGYGAIREILRNQDNWRAVDAVVLADGLHTSYLDGKLGAIDTAPLLPFLAFAREAVAGRKVLFITHSEIFPGTFASTTETADFLLGELGVKARAVLKWGPGGMQQLSQARAGRLTVLGFAGNSAPDHIDHFHGLATWLKQAQASLK